MKRKKMAASLLFAVLLAGGILFVTPVVLTIISSFRLEGTLSLQGYRELFFDCFPFYQMFWNSVLYSVSITVGAIVIAVPAAFAFRFAIFPGKNALFVFYIVLMMMPLQVMILPNYISIRDMKLINTPFAIILPLLFSPLAVVMIHQFLREFDIQMIEAARLETNSCLKILLFCIVPQMKVCLMAVGLLLYAETWNLVEQPLLYLEDDKWKNLSLLFSESERYGAEILFPASVLFMIPVLLWYLLFHEELRKGLKWVV